MCRLHHSTSLQVNYYKKKRTTGLKIKNDALHRDSKPLSTFYEAPSNKIQKVHRRHCSSVATTAASTTTRTPTLEVSSFPLASLPVSGRDYPPRYAIPGPPLARFVLYLTEYHLQPRLNGYCECERATACSTPAAVIGPSLTLSSSSSSPFPLQNPLARPGPSHAGARRHARVRNT